MEIKYLQVLVMPNKEIIYKGKTVGFIGDSETSVEEKHLVSKNKILKKNKPKQSLKIPFTTNNYKKLHNNKSFKWYFPTNKNEKIDIKIILDDENK